MTALHGCFDMFFKFAESLPMHESIIDTGHLADQIAYGERTKLFSW